MTTKEIKKLLLTLGLGSALLLARTANAESTNEVKFNQRLGGPASITSIGGETKPIQEDGIKRIKINLGPVDNGTKVTITEPMSTGEQPEEKLDILGFIRNSKTIQNIQEEIEKGKVWLAERDLGIEHGALVYEPHELSIGLHPKKGLSVVNEKEYKGKTNSFTINSDGLKAERIFRF